ncbi:MAG: hypothetical protein HZB38_13325 [Planctomycetes bacterium]|nr:hypothetical protein [Planctomycetota bacterium]
MLVLAVAIAAAWVRSYWYVEILLYESGNSTDILLGLASGEAQLQIVSLATSNLTPQTSFGRSSYYRRNDLRSMPIFPTNFGIRKSPGLAGSTVVAQWGFWMPLWLPVIVLFALAGLLFWSARHARRRLLDGIHCFHCGYDLHGTPERCPECGERPGVYHSPTRGKPTGAWL